MISDEIRKKLQNIIRGTGFEGETDRCASIRNLLIQSFGTSESVKSEFESRAIIKEKQAQFLKIHSQILGLWLDFLPNCEYLSHGGEALVYLASDKLNVIKVNDAIYYATWAEYFNSLVIHNLLFPNTAYSLIGFMEHQEKLCAVLQQPFIEGVQPGLEDIKELLNFNGFENTKRQDYYNMELGLLLEDMHDENIISRQDVLFFIDTVFYIMKNR